MSSRFILWNEIICNLFVYAGQVPLSRVHFDPKQESDCLENFKIICSTFRKLDIDKVIDNIGGLRRIIQWLLSRVLMSTAWWSWSSKTTCFSSTGSRSSLTRRPRSREGYQESENVYLIQNLNSAVITQFYIVMNNIFPTSSESKVIMIHWKLDTERLWVREAHGVLSGVLVAGLTISGGEHINRILINLSWGGLLGG